MLLTVLVLFCGCAAEKPGPYTKEEARANGIVKLYYPADFFKDEDVEMMAEQFRETEGIKKVTVFDDNSMTIRVTEEKYDEQTANMEQMVENMYKTVGGDDSFFKTVKKLEYTPDCTSLTLTVNREAYENSDEEKSVKQIIYIARLYQVYALETEREIKVDYIDENSGNVYKTEKYNASGEIKSSN